MPMEFGSATKDSHRSSQNNQTTKTEIIQLAIKNRINTYHNVRKAEQRIHTETTIQSISANISSTYQQSHKRKKQIQAPA